MDWFGANNVTLIEWPACSSDLNVIENYWKILPYRFYTNGSFNSDDLLWKSIQDAAEDIHVNRREIFYNLVQSMPQRLVNVIKSNGKTVKYYIFLLFLEMNVILLIVRKDMASSIRCSKFLFSIWFDNSQFDFDNSQF